jgi:predicted transcriptional regulator
VRLSFALIPLLSLAACAGPQAVAPAGAAVERKPAAESSIARGIRDEDVGAFFSFLRQTMDAAATGKPPPELPPELTRRADEIGRQVQREGAEAARILLDEMEREVRQMLREQR